MWKGLGEFGIAEMVVRVCIITYLIRLFLSPYFNAVFALELIARLLNSNTMLP